MAATIRTTTAHAIARRRRRARSDQTRWDMKINCSISFGGGWSGRPGRRRCASGPAEVGWWLLLRAVGCVRQRVALLAGELVERGPRGHVLDVAVVDHR